jgi:hypothetical protein
VLCLAREYGDQEQLLCIANLTPFPKMVAMPVWQVRRSLRIGNERVQERNLKLRDLLTGETILVQRDHSTFRFNMQRFGRHIFESDT